MKSLAIFVFLAHQLLFFNLLSMEDKIIDENDPKESQEEQLAKSYPINININQKNKLSKYESGNLNFDSKTIRFYNQDTDDTYIYEGDRFIGELPPQSEHILESLQKFSAIRKIFPILIEVSGHPFSGKTTLIRHFVNKINCTPSQFLEIGSLNDIDEIKKTLNSKGITLKQLPSEKINRDKNETSETLKKKKNRDNKLQDIEAVIGAFYDQKAIKKQPYIINFMNGLKLTNTELQKLRETIKKIQQKKIAPLTVFFESRSNGSSDNFHFLDEIIHIYPPTPKDIEAILISTFADNNYKCEDIKPQILSKFQSAVGKKQYTPAHLQRIAEKIVRSAIFKREEIITNDRIEKVIKS